MALTTQWLFRCFFALRAGIFCLLMGLCASGLSHDALGQQVSNWVDVDRDDIQVITDPTIEAEARLHLIRKAKTEISLITFDQRYDSTVGMPLLDALEEAAAAGVRVRFAMGGFMQPYFDFWGRVRAKLDSIVEKYPNHFQYTFVGGYPMFWSTGWKCQDGAHEKLLLVDGKFGMTTGRGHADQYLDWLDTAFLFKGNLVAPSYTAFNALWKTVRRENPGNGSPAEPLVLAQPAPSSRDLAPSCPAYSIEIPRPHVPGIDSTFDFSKDQVEQLAFIWSWVDQESPARADFRARVLHFDFLDQMRKKADEMGVSPWHIDLEDRLYMLRDPIVKEVLTQLMTAKRFRLNIFATLFHPWIKNAMMVGLNHGLSLDIATNAKKGHDNIVPFASGWYGGLEDMDDLLHEGPTGARVFLMNPRDGVQEDPVYLHRKLAIIEPNPRLAPGKQSSVIFGSHNLSYASSVVLDEMSFQVEGDAFVAMMNQVFDKSVRAPYFMRADRDLIRHEREDHPKSVWLGQALKWMY